MSAASLSRQLLFTCILLLAFHHAGAAGEETITFELVGKLAVYRPDAPEPACSVVLVSGAQGWKGKAAEMAQRIASEAGCLVSGIDMTTYQGQLKDEKLFCPIADVGGVSTYALKTLGYKKYLPPVFVGLGEGATLVYAALSEVTDGPLGGFGFDFCPDLPVVVGRSCGERAIKAIPIAGGRISFLPYVHMQLPFVVFNEGVGPKTGCSVKSAADYLKQVPLSRLQTVAAAGSSNADWMPAFKRELAEMLKRVPPPPRVASLSDLPLTEMPSDGHPDTMFIIFSGDGGFVDLSRDIADELSAQKYAVVGLDTLRYFWNRRTPAQAGADLERMISGYLAAWKKKKAVLIGYSYGAEVVPVMLNRLNPAARSQLLAGAVLIGPSPRTQLEFNVAELSRHPGPPVGDPLMPVLKKIHGAPRILCIGGAIERESLCRTLDKQKALLPDIDVEIVAGGHMFGRGNDDLTGLILKHFNLQ